MLFGALLRSISQVKLQALGGKNARLGVMELLKASKLLALQEPGVPVMAVHTCSGIAVMHPWGSRPVGSPSQRHRM